MQPDLAACERVVSQEMMHVSKSGVGLNSREDVRQEFMLAAVRSARKHDGRDSMGFIRLAVRRRLSALLASHTATKRRPHDIHGAPIGFVNPDVEDWPASEQPSPEDIIAAREQVDRLREVLSPDAVDIINRCVAEDTPPDRAQLFSIRSELRKAAMATRDPYAVPPIKDYEDLTCHALAGPGAEGYDGADPICINCTAKFSCLPAAVANPEIWTSRHVRVWEVNDDHEVVLLQHREMTFADLEARIAARDRFVAEYMAANPSADNAKILAAVPEDLKVRRHVEPEVPEPVEEIPEEQPEADETAAEEEASKKPATKKRARKKKVTKPKAAAQEAPKKPATKKKTVTKPKAPPKPTKPVEATGDRPLHRDGQLGKRGKNVPSPKPVSEEDMTKAISKIKLGVRIEWEYGFQIVRKVRGGDEHIATLTKNGFLFNGDDQLYASLSAVSQVASGTPGRAGNDYFGILKSHNTEVRNTAGKVIAKKAMLPEL